MEREEYFVSNGAKLYGTLTLPDQGERFPGVLFIHGGGPQTRDGEFDNENKDWFPKPVPSRKLFVDEAAVFKDIGIASFRYDKRGSGESEGELDTVGLLGLVEDARNAIAWLSRVPEIDPERIGVLGQSDGTAICLMLAAENPAIRFLVLQGSFYNSGAKVIQWQAENFWKSPQVSIDATKQNVPLFYWIYKHIDNCIDAAKKGDDTYLLGDENWATNWNLSWLRDLIENPPYHFAPKVQCPVLLLQGELDHNTPATEVPLLKQALNKAGNNAVTAHIFHGLDHSFRRLGHPDEDFITAMKRPLDPTMVEHLVGWLKKVALQVQPF